MTKVQRTMAAMLPLLRASAESLLNGPCTSSMMVPMTLVDLASGQGTFSSWERARPTAANKVGRIVLIRPVAFVTAVEVVAVIVVCSIPVVGTDWVWVVVTLSGVGVVSSTSSVIPPPP